MSVPRASKDLPIGPRCGRGSRLMLAMVVILISLSAPSVVCAVSPDEIFHECRHAFLTGRWNDTITRADTFSTLWPDHQHTPQIARMRLLAEVRADRQREIEVRTRRRQYFRREASRLAGVLDAAERAEIDGSATAESEIMGPASGSLAIDPHRLLQVLRLGFEVPRNRTPIEILQWLRDWEDRWRGVPHPPTLPERIALLRTRLYMRIWLSPLSHPAHIHIIKSWNEWPIARAIAVNLDRAFASADPTIKREACLLGIGWASTGDHLEANSGNPRAVDRQRERSWRRFVNERGIHTQEAWFPQ